MKIDAASPHEGAVVRALVCGDQRRRERLGSSEFNDLFGTRSPPMILEDDIGDDPWTHGEANGQEQPLRAREMQPAAGPASCDDQASKRGRDAEIENADEKASQHLHPTKRLSRERATADMEYAARNQIDLGKCEECNSGQHSKCQRRD
jgi:hypothetical protein